MSSIQQVQIRPVEPYEAIGVVNGVFAGLSAESRRLRFHVPMPRLPTSFRDRLARLDGRRHAALAARYGSEVIGVGRLVALSASECEIALAVIDEWQGRGVGRSILGGVIDLAVGYGYQTLVAEILAENSAMVHLVCDVFPEAECTRSRGVLHLRCELRAARHGLAGVPVLDVLDPAYGGVGAVAIS